MKHLVFTILILLGNLEAAPRFASCLGDYAVLQRGEKIEIHGFEADPAAPLFVRLGEEKINVAVGKDGQWKAVFPNLKSSSEERSLELIENGNVVATVRGVVVGEVWLAAGQSNMQMQVRSMIKGMPPAESWVASSALPQVRFRRVNDKVIDERDSVASDLSSREAWVKMTPESVLSFSAAAAVFAREIAEKVNCPVGIIDVSWGGKPIESFIPRESFSTPLLSKIKELADAEKLDELKALPGGVIIRNPEGNPGAIFNSRVAPLTNYSMAGFLWYQAESNAGRGEDPREYRQKMAALASGWRERWDNESLPFYFVQLPAFPPATGWIRAREEQRLALSIPNSAMVVTIDIRGEGIHPPDKLELGKRLARCALKGAYGKADVVASGPAYLKNEITGGKVKVFFSETNGGLAVGDRPEFADVIFSDDVPLQWFELAGEDGVWHPAEATIKGDSVIVESDSETDPVAVRYACSTAPQGGNLYNRAGLPASPFCSNLNLLKWVDQN